LPEEMLGNVEGWFIRLNRWVLSQCLKVCTVKALDREISINRTTAPLPATGQPTRSTQPFILSRLINE